MLNINVALYCQGKDFEKIQDINKELKTKINSIKKPGIVFTPIYYYDIIKSSERNRTSKNSTPMLDQLMNDIKSHKKYDMVAVPSIDILGENLSDLKLLIEEFQSSGVSIYPINDNYFKLNNDLENKLFFSSNNRIKVPFGYYLKQGLIHPSLENGTRKSKPLKLREPGNIVQWIFNSFLKDRSYAEVAKQLNNKSVPPPMQVIQQKKRLRPKHSTWNRQQIKNIILNNFYLGNENMNSKHKPLISKEVWEEANSIAQNLRRDYN
ncbi:MAG: hypothetical protein HeimC3_10110 [Candidatus Heimdallarchaeota archaeon LC_3]|nr:MAG: hypothetical protein HeimC3_10110 [Candidatus Heimdallarchaeota archaeon LC_3]